jgi:hypothetical protein
MDGPAGPEDRVTGAVRSLALDMNAIILGYGVPEDAGASGVDAWNRLEEVPSRSRGRDAGQVQADDAGQHQPD